MRYFCALILFFSSTLTFVLQILHYHNLFFITFISCFMLHNMRVLVVGEHFFIISEMNKTSCFKSRHFINIYIINRTLHGRLGIRILSSRAERTSHSFASLTRGRYFQHSKIKFVSPRGHVVSSIYYIDTDEIPGFLLLLKNHIFTARSERIIFILLDGPLGIRILSSRAESISHSFASLTRERYLQHSKIKFVSPRGHVISSIYLIYL